MTDDPDFTPNSPLTRKPRRSYLFLWVLLGMLIFVGATVAFDTFLPGVSSAISNTISAVLGIAVFIGRVIAVATEQDAAERRKPWLLRLLDKPYWG